MKYSTIVFNLLIITLLVTLLSCSTYKPVKRNKIVRLSRQEQQVRCIERLVAKDVSSEQARLACEQIFRRK